jgi:ferritin
MISKKMQDALNEQVTAEFYSAYLYLAMEAGDGGVF